jgi:mannose-1-phosphate guanylyltransferase/mannose-6-phosphate isomerase
VQQIDANAVLAVLPADHHVADASAFVAAIERAAVLAQKGPIVTLGIEPAYAETGFGYIERGEPEARVAGAYRVARFHEKPNAETATAYLERGCFYWNAGIFVMRSDVLLHEIDRQLPDLSASLEPVGRALGSASLESSLRTAYEQIEGVSMDHGVMEGARDVAVIPVDCGWSDVGSWRALGARVDPDADGNVSFGRTVAIDARDCILYADPDHVVAAIDVEGLVVVHTADATLVVPADRSQRVREVSIALEKKGWRRFQ